MNGATVSKVHPGPTFRGGLNVRTAGVGGGDGGGGVWLEGQEEGRREGLEWVVWAWVACVGGGEAGGEGGREEGREREGERGQLTA